MGEGLPFGSGGSDLFGHDPGAEQERGCLVAEHFQDGLGVGAQKCLKFGAFAFAHAA